MRKLALYLAGCTAAVMVVMAVLGIATGASQELHEHFAQPQAYAMALVERGGALRVMMGLDLAFIVLYTMFFAAEAAYLRERRQPAVLVWLGFAAIVATALLDFVEDHHILVLLDEAEAHVLPTIGAIAFQSVLSATKFSCSFIGFVAFGLAIPRDTKLGLGFGMFLVIGTLISAVLSYAAPPDSLATLETMRFAGFFLGFVLGIAWLRKQPD
ncbi:MAG TPA: hypothetical protein VGF94_16085 [Kofleriaceae bacterium]|jgi:hypothetical protein